MRRPQFLLKSQLSLSLLLDNVKNEDILKNLAFSKYMNFIKALNLKICITKFEKLSVADYYAIYKYHHTSSQEIYAKQTTTKSFLIAKISNFI